MSLTRADLLKGFEHPDIFVRGPILKYFGDSRDQGTDVTRAAIAAIERYGWDEAFEWPHEITRLTIDDETGRWLAAELLREGKTAANINTKGHLMSWFAKAPLPIVNSLLDEVTRFPLWGRDFEIFGKPSVDFQTMSAQERVAFRLALSSSSATQCADQLEEALSRAADAESFPHLVIQQLNLMCERYTETQPQIREIAIDWLNVDFNLAIDRDHYRAGIGIRLAGHLKLHAAVPRFLEMFDFDWDWWNEIIEIAIADMGTPEALAAVIAGYPTVDLENKLFLTGVMEDLRFPHMQADLMALLCEEDDDMVRTSLGFALARYGTPIAMTAAQGIIDEWPEDPDRFGIAEVLYAFRSLLGEHDALLQRWRAQFEKWRTQDRFMREGLHVVPKPVVKNTGRNDPCPCGSGKKFKKCCLVKL